ncbi:MAG: RNA pyrophosphohydrolase [Alphaproteobacteria bacterium]|tara:strand:+ start:648 stop:1115 length:468 start_codon:yes stop_codon:yes gene_type:complete
MNKNYRKGVGVFLINENKKLWVGKRLDHKNQYWQMPQGGIDKGESPENAMKRELLEETGLSADYKIIRKANGWLKYDLPKKMIEQVWQGKFLGQIQMWYACLFFGEDKQVNLNFTDKPEFCNWKWIDPSESINLAVPFKKNLYKSILEEFEDILS